MCNNENYGKYLFPFIVCAQRADIAFVVDASTSVTYSGFIEAKEFVKSLISGMKVSYKGVNVGLIRFATTSTIIFPLNRYFSQRSVNNAIDRMVYSQGGTRTDRALKTARTELFTKIRGAREDIPRMLVLMTDGKSNNPTFTRKEAHQLKKSGVYVIVVAISNKVNKVELRDIASQPEDVITAVSYRTLKKIVADTREKVCSGECQL